MAAGLAADRRTEADLAALSGFVHREHTVTGSAAVAANSGFHEALVAAANHGMLSTLMAPVEGHVRRAVGCVHERGRRHQRRVLGAVDEAGEVAVAVVGTRVAAATRSAASTPSRRSNSR
jgi:DNA-binding GntR family transcriptional regulator